MSNLGFTFANTTDLQRTAVWTGELKQTFDDFLIAQKWVRMIANQGGSTTINIPVLGNPTVDDYAEGDTKIVRKFDTGNYQFTPNKFKSTGTAITDKAKEDLFYYEQLLSSFLPKHIFELQRQFEKDVFALQSKQTASSTNTINDARHRYVAGGSNSTVIQSDFDKARYALRKANQTMNGLVAVVDPSVTMSLQNDPNVKNNLSPDPMWSTVRQQGLSDGSQFRFNFAGFDVYETNYLADITSETIAGASVSNGKANLFFSTGNNMALPFIGTMVRPPKVEQERVAGTETDIYYVTMRYGLDLFYPENLVVVLSNTNQVYA